MKAEKNLYCEYRDDLVDFLRQQTLGPGGCAHRYRLLSQKAPLQEEEEILDANPGNIYSTGIIFPERSGGSPVSTPAQAEDDEDISEDEPIADDETVSEAEIAEKAGEADAAGEDNAVWSLARQYPSIFGLTCRLSGIKGENPVVKVTGRYYTPLTEEEYPYVGLKLTEKQPSLLKKWLAEYADLAAWIKLEDGCVALTPQYLSAAKARATASGGNRDKTEEETSSGDRNATYETLNEIDCRIAGRIAEKHGVKDWVRSVENRNLLNYYTTLFERLKATEDEREYMIRDTEERLKRIEAFREMEEAHSLWEDIKRLTSLKRRGSYGLWRAHAFVKEIDLAGIDICHGGARKQYTPDEYPMLKDVLRVKLGNNIALSLDLWLQTICQNGDTYLKVLIRNSSTSFDNSGRAFSIVSDSLTRLCVYGAGIEVVSGRLKPYRQYDEAAAVTFDDPERASLDYLYRKADCWATGHMCATQHSQKGGIHSVSTEWMPVSDTPMVESVPRDRYVEEGECSALAPEETTALRIRDLSTLSDIEDREIRRRLLDFANAYGRWIEATRSHIDDDDDLPRESRPLAEANLAGCNGDLQRMLANINDILAPGTDAMRCFRAMNTAMFIQQWHNAPERQDISRKSDGARQSEQWYRQLEDSGLYAPGQPAMWRPFQLAFILLNLDGIFRHPADGAWTRRNDLADLVWFPTGGGKTEAYLGLIALCVLNRRSSHGDRGAGVAVIMRYTLRLLTTQQFQRALRLIAALERMRAWPGDPYGLGHVPVTLGLYVGEQSLPNTLQGLDGEWQKRRNGDPDKIPLDHCPWCGSDLAYNQGAFRCANHSCHWANTDLPVTLCDELVYQNPPTLLLATVDKMASLAWKANTNGRQSDMRKDSRRLFGRTDNGQQQWLTPDLIIQDELHLMTGPLGSAVGLFECAIDLLCRRTDEDGRTLRPKVISSTATTRNTPLQIRGLYDRDVNIFPHNGLYHDDSFFAFHSRTMSRGIAQYRSLRRYLGVMPTGRTQQLAHMRLSAALMVFRYLWQQSHQSRDEGWVSAADYFHTVIAYFNNLKEVGVCDVNFAEDYLKYIRRLARRVLPLAGGLERLCCAQAPRKSELTGRLSGAEVLGRFADAATEYRPSEILRKDGMPIPRVPEYILATNMISVGLDVSRLNTMLVDSMPRNVAEYIQASSRVARRHEGLVVTLFDPYKTRDVSYYERFDDFHSKLYYYVEPLSVTPFSRKALERYLPLVIGVVARHLYPSLADNAAASLDSRQRKDDVGRLKTLLADYFHRLHTRMNENAPQSLLLDDKATADIDTLVERALDEWNELASEDNLTYTGDNQPSLFREMSEEAAVDDHAFWRVARSLRIVDAQAVLKVDSGLPARNKNNNRRNNPEIRRRNRR